MQKVKEIETLKKEFFDEGVRMAKVHGFIMLDEVRKKFPEVNYHDKEVYELIAELCKGFDSVVK